MLRLTLLLALGIRPRVNATPRWPAPQHRADHLRRSRLDRLLASWGIRTSRTPHLDRLAAREPDVPPRLRAVEPLLSQPGVDHHGPLSASAQGDQQRSAAALAGTSRAKFNGRPTFRRGARSDEPAPGSRAHTAAHAGAARLPQLSDRQVVAGRLPPRRLHARHDPRAAPRRRGPGHRPQDDAADLRLHRRVASGRAEAVLRLVRADDAARSAHAAGAAAWPSIATIAPSEHVAHYWAMVEWFDETVGQLLDHLDQQKLAENTIVVYWPTTAGFRTWTGRATPPSPSSRNTTAACARRS